MAETQVAASPAFADVTVEGNDFAKLLKKEFKPKSDEARSAVEAAVYTLAQQALAHTTLIGSDTVQSIEAMIAAIDRKMSEQVNAIMHHADFKKLESAWRGLHYMVNNTETDETLKIKVLNISKKEIGRSLKKFRDRIVALKQQREDIEGAIEALEEGCVRLERQLKDVRPDLLPQAADYDSAMRLRLDAAE